MMGFFSHFEHCGQQKMPKFLFIIGAITCCALFAIICDQSEDARSAYCLVFVSLLLLTEALPTQVTAMMTLFFFAEFEFLTSWDYHLPVSIVHLVAMVLALESTDSTTLAYRAAAFVFTTCGTRLRNMQLACMALSCLLSLLMEETVAVLLMLRLVREAVYLLQQEGIQTLHQRELLRKMAERMPALAAQPAVREALLEGVEQDRSPESTSSPREGRGVFWIPVAVQSANRPAAPLRFQRSGSSAGAPLVVPALSLSISELVSLMATLSRDSVASLDDDGSPSSEMKDSSKGLPADLRLEEDDNECCHTGATSLSAKLQCAAKSIAPPRRWAAAQCMHPKMSNLDRSSLNVEPSEAAAETLCEKMSACSSDSSLGKTCPESVTGVPERAPQWTAMAADQRRHNLWTSVFNKVSHGARAAFAPLESLMAKKAGSSELTPATSLGESAVTEVSATSPSPFLRGLTPKSAMLRESRKGAGKTATLLEDGKIFLPGDSSPPKKHGKERKRKAPVPAELRDVARHIYFWKKERYQLLHKELFLSVVATCAITSIMNLSTNNCNLEFLLYFRRNFGHEAVVSTDQWWLLFFPPEVVAILCHWHFMWMTFFRHYDAPQAAATRSFIRLSVEKRSTDLGVVTFAELVQLTIIILWLLIYCTLFAEAPVRAREYEKLELDFFVIVALLSFPWSWPHQFTTASIRPLIKGVPWGAIITYGSTFTLSFAVKSSFFVTWLRVALRALDDRHRVVPQALLTICASLMAELVSSRHTVRILLPVAIEMAIAQPYNPLYYALPITVAAASPMILPTARFSVALLGELTNMRPFSMVLYGLLVKVVIVIFALISVDTVGHQIFDWSALPEWMFAQRVNITREWHTRENLH